MSAPSPLPFHALTAVFFFDKLRRGEGREAPTQRKVSRHADAHKYCPLGRCGSRPGAYQGGHKEVFQSRSAKITAWRKAKAQANRRYLEERVYGKA